MLRLCILLAAPSTRRKVLSKASAVAGAAESAIPAVAAPVAATMATVLGSAPAVTDLNRLFEAESVARRVSYDDTADDMHPMVARRLNAIKAATRSNALPSSKILQPMRASPPQSIGVHQFTIPATAASGASRFATADIVASTVMQPQARTPSPGLAHRIRAEPSTQQLQQGRRLGASPRSSSFDSAVAATVSAAAESSFKTIEDTK